MGAFTISEVLDRIGMLLQTPGLLEVYAYMFAVSMLIGGVLDWSSKSYFLYLLTTFVGLLFTEWIRRNYLLFIGEEYTAMPIAMAIVTLIIYSVGIVIGIGIVQLTRHNNKLNGELAELLDASEEAKAILRRSTDALDKR